jgi:hypothetical protein
LEGCQDGSAQGGGGGDVWLVGELSAVEQAIEAVLVGIHG